MKNILLLSALAYMLFSCGNAPTKSKSNEMQKSDSLITDHARWSRNATIYEVNIRQYTPEGTFKAFGESLPRLRDMGVKILWLMPINPIGEKNRKGSKGSYYSIRDYKGVNPEFGNLDDFKNLVNEAHAMDMKVILDWVANHSAFDNIWTRDHLDWYELDSLGRLQPPHGTDWWDVTEFDYSNSEMRAAMIDAMKYWVTEAGVDGFRCDVASMVPIDFWVACRDSLEQVKPDIFMLAEGEDPELHKAFDMTYAFEFMHLMNTIAKNSKPLSDIDTYLEAEKEKYAPADYRMYFTSSHDENSWNGTVYERYGDGAKVYAVLAATLAGMPMVYSGQEAGLNKALSFFEKDSIAWSGYRLVDFYTHLLQLNRKNEALWNGTFGADAVRIKTNADSAVYAFYRKKDAHQVVVVCNLKGAEVSLTADELPEGDFQSLFGKAAWSDFKNGNLTVPPFGYHVFYRE